MPLEIRCPNPECRKLLKAATALEGKQAVCPACGHPIPIVDPNEKTMAVPPGQQRAPAKPAGPPDPLLGKTIGNFDILGKLGEGGMAAVYRAKNRKLLKQVALKVIPEKLVETDPELGKRFIREARAAAKLEHPNIAIVHSVDKAAGYYFIEMQLIDGQSVGERIFREKRLPVEEAVRISVHGKGSDSGPLLNMTIAYDLIRDAQYPDGRRLLVDDTARRIRDDLIAAGCADLEHWHDISNKGVATFALSAAAGILLEQPERVRFALGGFNWVMEERYHFDGFYSESPAYAAHNFSNMRELPDLLYGYSDPPGYQPKQGPRLDNPNPFTAGRTHLALQSMVRMLAPGNRLPAIGDTVYDTRLSVLYAEVLAARSGGQYAGLLETLQGAGLSEKGSEYALWYRPPDLQAPEGPVRLPLRTEWFPGWHVGVLRGGREANDTALYLNGNEHRWTLRTGHRHQDILGMSYYAFGEELVSDRGYFSGSGQLTRDGRSGQRWVRDYPVIECEEVTALHSRWLRPEP